MTLSSFRNREKKIFQQVSLRSREEHLLFGLISALEHFCRLGSLCRMKVEWILKIRENGPYNLIPIGQTICMTWWEVMIQNYVLLYVLSEISYIKHTTGTQYMVISFPLQSHPALPDPMHILFQGYHAPIYPEPSGTNLQHLSVITARNGILFPKKTFLCSVEGRIRSVM